MRRIADAEQARPAPVLEAVHRDGEQLQIVPGSDLLDAIGEFRIEAGDGGAERIKPLAAEHVEAAFGDDIGALPIVAAVECDEHHAGLDAAERLGAVGWALGEAEPDHVHRRAEILDFQSGPQPHIGVAAVGTDDEIGPDLQRPFRRLGMQAEHAAMLGDEIGDARAHPEMKARIAARLLGEKIQKVPLRHQGDEAAMRRQMREIGNDHALIADQRRKLAQLLMRALEEGVDDAERVHHL